jgi:hypothetical protein
MTVDDVTFVDLEVGDLFRAKDQGRVPHWMKGTFCKVHRRQNTYKSSLAANSSRYPLPKHPTHWDEEYWNSDWPVERLTREELDG